MKKLFIALLLSLLLGMDVTANVSAGTDTGVESFVKRFYTTVLGRDADAGGLNYWSSKLEDKTLSATDVANGFIFSEEFMIKTYGNIDFMNVLYRAFFDREPDTGGLAYWLDEMEKGSSREDVVHGFLYSSEFKVLAERYGIEVSINQIESFVKRFYVTVLGRDADAGGLNYWASKLEDKTLSATDVANGFIFSEEFKTKAYDNVDFMNTLYRAFFDREADASGLAYWLDDMEKDSFREDVVHGFLYSSEFKVLAESYGIEVSIDTPEKPDVPDTGNQNGFTSQLLASLNEKELFYSYAGENTRSSIVFLGNNRLMYSSGNDYSTTPFSIDRGVIVITNNASLLKIEIEKTISDGKKWQMFITDTKHGRKSLVVTYIL